MEIENRNLPKKNYDFFLMLKQINQIENTLWSLRDCMFWQFVDDTLFFLL